MYLWFKWIMERCYPHLRWYFFSRKRVKSDMLSLFSRNENCILFYFHSFREWKVKWKCLEFEIESEKWNENASRSRSRSEISREFSRNSWESRIFFIYPLCIFKCLFKFHVWVNANLHWLHLVEFLHCRFQMCPQITYFTVNIQMRPQIACLKGCKATLTTFLFYLSPLCFSSVSSNIHSKRMHCHNSRIGQNTPHSVSKSNILCSQVNLGSNL